jgi:hypothetical protein
MSNLHFFCDDNGFWHWQFIDGHGTIIDQSTFGFLDKENCEKQAQVKGYS